MEKGEGNLKLLRKKFENSIDREVIESVFNTVEKNYKNAHEILMDMLKTTNDYNTVHDHINGESSNSDIGIWTKSNNIRNPTKVDGVAHKVNSNNNSPKRRNTRNPSKKEIAITDAIALIRSGAKVMILLRGVPGSGKSFLAKQIVQEAYGTTNYNEHIFSSDDFFSLSGRYCYVREQISEAHVWNQNRVHWNVRNGCSPVIVDNTHVLIWEMKAYAQMAVEYGYFINILEPATPWATNHIELTKRNQHNVPKEKIRDMLGNYDQNVTAGKLLVMFGLRYGTGMQPPQQRLRPPMEPVEQMAAGGVEMKENGEEAAGVVVNNNLIDLDTIPLPPTPMPSSHKKPILNTEDNLHAWGLTEHVLNSWNMVETIQDNSDDIHKPTTSSQAPLNNNKVEYRGGCSNTCSRDFAIAQGDLRDAGVRIINAYSRVITRGIASPTLLRKNKNRVTTFEKGTMTTSDIDTVTPINEDTSETDLAMLRNLFSDIPVEYLRDVYEKCKRNTNWTVDLLLDDKREILTSIPTVSTAVIHKVHQQSVEYKSSIARRDSSNKSPSLNTKNEAIDSIELINLLDDSMSGDEPPPPKQIKPFVDSMKKHIESLVHIGQEFYSDHVFNVKSFREGASSIFESDVAGCSKNINGSDKISNLQIDADMDIDDFEMEQVMKMVPSAMDCAEFMELNLGSGLVRQLETQFGDPHLIYPDGLLPTIQVPVSFARQLHAFYLESVFEQLENQQAVYEELCKEDEAYATKLQEEENRKLLKLREKQRSQEPVPQLAEIMQEQAFQREYFHSKLSADDLASKLTRQKLFDNFPTVSQETMLDIFAAHDNDYVKTVEILLNTGVVMMNADEFPLRPPVEKEVVNEMKQAEENLKQNKQQHNVEIVHSADEYRQLALRHASRRNELMSRAQEYHRRGMGDVAMFYSRLAREESDLYDQTNARAAESFLQQHSTRLEKFDTIDLHYLQAKEVIPALDIFLDRHINLLQGPNAKRTEILYVITGRGKHSRGGVSVIRPIVITRLGKRKIGYVLMNPGLLQITANHNSPITNDLR